MEELDLIYDVKTHLYQKKTCENFSELLKDNRRNGISINADVGCCDLDKQLHKHQQTIRFYAVLKYISGEPFNKNNWIIADSNIEKGIIYHSGHQKNSACTLGGKKVRLLDVEYTQCICTHNIKKAYIIKHISGKHVLVGSHCIGKISPILKDQVVKNKLCVLCGTNYGEQDTRKVPYNRGYCSYKCEKIHIIENIYEIPFGKYKGKLLKYVIDNDESYINWIFETKSKNKYFRYKDSDFWNILNYYFEYI